MKKIYSIIAIFIVTLGIIILSTPSVLAAETWTTVDLTQRFADAAAETYEETLESSSGWSYSHSDVYNFRIKTKRIQLQVNRLTEVKVPRFYMTGNNAGTYATDSFEVPAYASVWLKFYATPESSTPLQTISLHGILDDFSRLPNYEAIDVNPLHYVEIEWLLNFEFAQGLKNGVDGNTGPGQAWQFVNWSYVNGSYKKMFDSTFYTLRGSFRNDIMTYRYPNPNKQIFDSRAGEDAYYDPEAHFPVSYYKASIKGETLVDVDEEDIVTIEDLPTTTGSIYQNPNLMGQAKVVDVSGYNLMLEIKYSGETYYLEFTFDEETDMEMFEKAESREGHYYTYESLKYVILNLDEGSMFTVTSGNVQNQKFVPYVIWNLDSNEFYKFDRVNVYVTVFEEEAHNVFAYFYVDQFIIDNLITATISMQWRYVNIFGWASEWYPYAKTLTSGYSSGGGGMSWEAAAALTSAAGLYVSTLLPPPANAIGIGVFGLATIYFNYLMWDNILSGQNIFSGNVEEISLATGLSQAKINEINALYRKKDPSFQGMHDEYKLWKLHLGQFNKIFEDHIEVKDDSFKVVQFNYKTNGQLYTIEEDTINTIFDPGDLAYDPTRPIIPSFDLQMIVGLGVGALVAGLIVVGAAQRGALFNKKRFDFMALISTVLGAGVAGLIFGFIAYFIAGLI